MSKGTWPPPSRNVRFPRASGTFGSETTWEFCRLRSGPMADTDYVSFADLTFDDFRRLAREDGLTQYERIGFPDSYREGFEEAIFEDLKSKLPALGAQGRTVLDIGP